MTTTAKSLTFAPCPPPIIGAQSEVPPASVLVFAGNGLFTASDAVQKNGRFSECVGWLAIITSVFCPSVGLAQLSVHCRKLGLIVSLAGKFR